MKTENEIRSLLGLPPLKGQDKLVVQRPITPETYLGSDRAGGYASGNILKSGINASYAYKGDLSDNQVGLDGKWLVSPQKITSTGESSYLDLNFLAAQVYLVMDSDTPQLVHILLDGKPLPEKYYTEDMNVKGQILVKEPRKYDVINLKNDYGRHKLTLQVPKGISMYAFTFGDEQTL
jgi:Thioredoxin like C-terminal domain